MKFLFLFLALSISVNWEPDFEHAKTVAAAEHKLILLNFSGSDWCAPCIVTRKDYLENPAFAEMAKNNLVLVNADFPRKKKNVLPADVVKRNEALADQYDKQGNFPFTVLLDAKGKVLKTWNGRPESSPEEWTKQVESICDANK